MPGDNKYYDGYRFSLTGRSHKTSNTPCQDSSVIYFGDNGLCFLAVADGVGSAECSEKGSSLATSMLYDYFKNNNNDSKDSEYLLNILKEGFQKALKAVEILSEIEGRHLYDYATTLTACIYDGEKVIIGHVGDSGIISVDNEGYYHSLTSVQKGEAYNEVYPLTSVEKWDFFIAEGSYSSVVLFTDGLLDVAIPPLLKKEVQTIYTRFFSMFLPYSENISGSKIKDTVISALESDSFSFIKDDISTAAVWKRGIDLKIPAEDYLSEPDWNAIQTRIFNSLYPHLNKKENAENATSNTESKSKN